MWNSKKILVLGLILFTLFGLFSSGIKVNATHVPGICIDPLSTNPQAPTEPDACAAAGFTWEGGTKSADTSYHLLEPIPCYGTEQDGCVNGQLVSFDPTTDTGNNKLGTYLNIIIRLFIGLCAVAAVVMIIIAGIQYSTSELISDKGAAKEKIQGAVLGLLLALGSWTILYTINPDLLNTDVDIGGTSLTSEGEQVIKDLIEQIITVGGPITEKNANSRGTTCDANVIYAAANGSLTAQEAATFACLITPESGCKSVKNYAWGRGSTAYGFYQILLQSHAQRFEIPACWSVVGTKPISCSRGFKDGNPLNNQYTQQCIKAATDFTCSTKVAVSILRDQGFSAWTADKNSAKQRACIARFSKKT